jgi:hypothetical protein
MFIYYLIAFLSCLSISFLIIGLSIKSERQIVKDRMAKRKTIIPGQPSQYSVEVEMSLPFKERVLIPFLSKLARLAGRVSPSGSTQLIEKKLITAGHPYGIGSREFLGIRVISCIGFILLGIVAAKFNEWKILHVRLGATSSKRNSAVSATLLNHFSSGSASRNHQAEGRLLV